MIQRTATDPSRFAHRWIFTNAARTAWELLLRNIHLEAGKSILLPAYIGITDREGSGVLDPVENTKTAFTLYPVGERLQVDLNVIEDLLKTGKHPLLLVMHWFGLLHVDMPALKTLCDRHGVLLIEDCAHVPGPSARADGPGSFGAAAFHSLHKMIAVPNGGALRVNDERLIVPVPNENEGCAGSTLEQFIRTDMTAVATARRTNYSWLVERLAKVEGIEVLYPSIGDLVPHDFPIRVHDGLREKLYFALMDQGLPTIALYYRMIAPITPEQFPLSHALSKSILNLPVHQDTTLADLELLSDALEASLKTLRA